MNLRLTIAFVALALFAACGGTENDKEMTPATADTAAPQAAPVAPDAASGDPAARTRKERARISSGSFATASGDSSSATSAANIGIVLLMTRSSSTSVSDADDARRRDPDTSILNFAA